MQKKRDRADQLEQAIEQLRAQMADLS
ncbi:MAG: hypothetical protein MR611_00830 [Coriobacteriaceae bacterium]|nr:hypothetical protein [Coriobacteriaceae bacterium]